MRHCLILLLTPAILLAGCVNTHVQTIGEDYPPRPENHLIDVYIHEYAQGQIRRAAPNARPFAELPESAQLIGDVAMDVDFMRLDGWGAMVNRGKIEARRIGGDAILIDSASSSSSRGLTGAYQASEYVNVVIYRYFDPPAPATSPATRAGSASG